MLLCFSNQLGNKGCHYFDGEKTGLDDYETTKTHQEGCVAHYNDKIIGKTNGPLVMVHENTNNLLLKRLVIVLRLHLITWSYETLLQNNGVERLIIWAKIITVWWLAWLFRMAPSLLVVLKWKIVCIFLKWKNGIQLVLWTRYVHFLPF